MKIELNDAFKPLLESRIDGNTIKTISDALNVHLLKTLKPARVEHKPGTENEPAKP